MQHNIQKKDGQESVCASWHADTYFLEMKYWTLHIQLIVLLDVLPLEHKEIKEWMYWCLNQVYSKTWFYLTSINILLKDFLGVTFRFHKVRGFLFAIFSMYKTKTVF